MVIRGARPIKWRRCLQLEKLFIIGAMVSASLNIGLIFYIKHSNLFVPDSHVSVVEDGPTVVLKKENGAGNVFTIEVYRNNDIVSHSIQNYEWESETLRALNGYFNDYTKEHNVNLSDLTFVDIGANIGWFSLNMAALGVNVLAFEPMEANIKIFQNSLRMSQNVKSGVSGRITLYEHGLGTKEETCILYSDNFNFGDGHVKCVDNEADLEMEEGYSVRGRVPLKRLDDVILNAKGMHIVAVKMDVEGYEDNVFEGGTHFFLDGGIDSILTEFVPDNIVKKGGDPVEFMKKMSNAGFLAKKNFGMSWDSEYWNGEEMLNMSNFESDMVTLHSPDQQNKTKEANKPFEGNTSYYDNMWENPYGYGNETSNYYKDEKSGIGFSKAKNDGNDFVIGVYPKDDIVSNAIRDYWGGWETDTVKTLNVLFQDYSKKHKLPLSDLTFVDIGANIGWLSLSLAALGVKVLAFEPMEENIVLLKKSLEMKVNIESGVSGRITLYEHGLGTKEETCIVYSDNFNIGDGHVKCVENEKDLEIQANYTVRGRVPIKRLDDVIVDKEGLHIVAVKMDTEGSEGNVLEGGQKLLLSGSVNAMITEFKPKWLIEKGADPLEFMTKMRDAGYRVKMKDRYMRKSEMINMTNFDEDELMFHSHELISEYMGEE